MTMHPDQNEASEDSSPLAIALSGMPEVWQRLLAEHIPDGHGRCAACRNTSTAGVPWPCTLQVVADDARSVYLRRLRPRRLSAPVSCGLAS